jgi:hypothetical protein
MKPIYELIVYEIRCDLVYIPASISVQAKDLPVQSIMPSALMRFMLSSPVAVAIHRHNVPMKARSVPKEIEGIT